MAPRRPEQFEAIREKSREKILAAALDLFAHKGYDATSIDSIAQKAGISKGLIYNYFKSKKSILLSLFADAMKLGEDMIDAQKNIRKRDDRIKMMIEQVFHIMHMQPEYMKLLTSISLQPGVMAETKEFRGDAYVKAQEWTSAITGKKGKNGLIQGLMMGALMDGIALNFIIYGDKYPLEELKKEIIKVYCSPEKKKKAKKK